MDLKILDQVFFGNSLWNYLIALVTLFVSLVFVKVVVRMIIGRLKKFAEKTITTIDDLVVTILERIVLPVLYLSCLYLSLKI
ncbi:MAG: hypothetical protein WC543_04205 [Candidatus Omnitrophota bacterium]